MDAYEEWVDSDEEQNPEEEEKPGFVFKPSYVLLALDADKSMFDEDDAGRSLFMECIDACYDVVNALVMTDSTSLNGPFGIVLSDNNETKANLIEFSKPVPDAANFLKDLKQQSNACLRNKFERTGPFDLGDFLLFCKKKLMQINADVYKRTVIFITNNDDPVQNDPKNRFKIISESQKFPGIQMELNVLTFKKNFDYNIFYCDVLSACNSSGVEIMDNSAMLTEKLNTLINRKLRKQRFKFYPFKDQTDLYVEVVVNKFVKSPNITKNMYVTKDTQVEVKKSMVQQENTGNYTCLYAKSEEPLILSEEEKRNILHTNIPIGYSLLYVGKETSTFGWVLQPPVLIEKYHKETELIFEIFWQFCHENSKCLVCSLKHREGGKINLVELVPKYINNTRMFLVRVLPFASEIHMPKMPVQPVKFKAEEEQAMCKLIDALTFKFHPGQFRDPVISRRQAYIKSQLLEEPLEQIKDGMPKNELMKGTNKEVEKLKCLGLDDTAKGSTKRASATSKQPGAASQKRLRKINDDEN